MMKNKIPVSNENQNNREEWTASEEQWGEDVVNGDCWENAFNSCLCLSQASVCHSPDTRGFQAT